MATTDVHIGERLAAAADRIAGLEVELRDERALRDSLIVEAIDNGWERAQVGRWSRMSATRVGQVVVEQTSVAV